MFTQFNKIVLIIATIILIVTLITISIFILKSKSENKFPPFVTDCPDYWDISTDKDSNKICVNNSTINTSTSSPNTDMSFCDTIKVSLWEEFADIFGSENCVKYTVSKYCGFNWDGISNNKNVCKDNNKDNN